MIGILMIELMIYLSGYILAAILLTTISYINGKSLTVNDLMFITGVSVFSWVTVTLAAIFLFFVGIGAIKERWGDKVLIKNKATKQFKEAEEVIKEKEAKALSLSSNITVTEETTKEEAIVLETF